MIQELTCDYIHVRIGGSPVAGRMNQRREQEAAAGGGEPDEDQLLNMLTSFADITGCELSVAQEYLQVQFRV